MNREGLDSWAAQAPAWYSTTSNFLTFLHSQFIFCNFVQSLFGLVSVRLYMIFYEGYHFCGTPPSALKTVLVSNYFPFIGHCWIYYSLEMRFSWLGCHATFTEWGTSEFSQRLLKEQEYPQQESPPAWTQEAYRPQEGARCWPPPPLLAGPDPPQLDWPLTLTPPQVWTDKQSETITFPSYYVRGR